MIYGKDLRSSKLENWARVRSVILVFEDDELTLFSTEDDNAFLSYRYSVFDALLIFKGLYEVKEGNYYKEPIESICGLKKVIELFRANFDVREGYAGINVRPRKSL